MADVKFTLDPKNPPKLSAEALARMDAVTPDEIETGAASDPDNPPLTEAELALVRGARLVKDARKAEADDAQADADDAEL